MKAKSFAQLLSVPVFLMLMFGVALDSVDAQTLDNDEQASGIERDQKQLIDYYLPMPLTGPLTTETWGDSIGPRDVGNGLEDTAIKDWCYWDGQIVKVHDEKYVMYASRWDQQHHHSVGWTQESKGIVAVSDNLIGPYKDMGEAWPHWQEGQGHNVIGLRLHDGRYAMVTSEITQGEVFVSDNPTGPFKLLGEIQVDNNGFDPGLVRYNNGPRRMANVMIFLRPDNRYMLMARNCAPMISDTGILGPYKVMSAAAWEGLQGVPQDKMEDPTIWYSDGLYHVVVNHHGGGDVTYHLTSEDGVHNWKNRGIAMRRDQGGIFHYPDGTRNEWFTVQRPTVYVEDGSVKAFNYSVIDVHKGRDGGDDQHGSKIVVVPFDGEAFGRDMRALVIREYAQAMKTPPPTPWKTDDLGAVAHPGGTGYDALVQTVMVEASGNANATGADAGRFVYQPVQGDVMLSALVMSQDVRPKQAAAGLMFRQSLDTDSSQVSANFSPTQGFTLQHRAAEGDSAQTLKAMQELRAPYFVRLVKQGNTVTISASQTNQHNWKTLGSATVDFAGPYYAGVFAASEHDGAIGLARFKNVDVHTLGTRDQILWHDLTDTIPGSGQLSVRVAFETSEPRDINIGMQQTKIWSGVGDKRVTVNGYGVIEIAYQTDNPISREHVEAMGTMVPYRIFVSLYPKGGNWKQTIESDRVEIEHVDFVK